MYKRFILFMTTFSIFKIISRTRRDVSSIQDGGFRGRQQNSKASVYFLILLLFIDFIPIIV